MEPIRVPKPPAESFHKHRRISDLLMWQIEHFKHVAQKKSLKIDPEIARNTHTEEGAARYIAAVTHGVHQRIGSGRAKTATVIPIESHTTKSRKTTTAKPKPGIARTIAATAEKRTAASPETHPRSQTPKKRVKKAEVGANRNSKASAKQTPKLKPKAAAKSRGKAKAAKTKLKKGKRS